MDERIQKIGYLPLLGVDYASGFLNGYAPEYVAKVNNIQVAGISFIEHLSFGAFNEGIRLKECIRLQQKLTGRKVTAVAADSIYANNANRKYCTEKEIATSFVRKRRATKDEKWRQFLRSELSRDVLHAWKEASVHTSSITPWQRSGPGTGKTKSYGYSSGYIHRMP